MSLPTNTFSTYSAVGNREDLADVIYRIDPTDTPFLSMLERVKSSGTHAVNHEWQTQALASRDTSNAVLEGDDAVTDSTTATVRLGNIHQISDKVARVTGTQQAVTHAGRDDEMEYQEMLKGLELKLDMDAILCGTNQAKNAGAAATARKTASVLSWIGTNDDFGATGASPTSLDGTATRTDGTQRVFTEAQLKTVIQSIWTQGGKPNTIMLGGFNKQAASTFTGRATPTEDAKSKKIVAAVNVYESDFGTLKFVPSRQVRSRDCLILQDEMWALAFLPGRNMASIKLAKTGDSERRQILSEYALEARNEKSSGGVFDLTTS
jgi:hypothetical protein